MKSHEARRREAWRLMAWEIGAVVVLLVLWATVEASMDGATVASFMQVAVLIGTAVIVWWYTKETQRLRETAQQQVEAAHQQIEVQQRPLIIVEPQRSDLLIVRNIGNSAAMNITIRAVKGPSTVMIPLLTHGSGTSIGIDTDGEELHARANLRALGRSEQRYQKFHRTSLWSVISISYTIGNCGVCLISIEIWEDHLLRNSLSNISAEKL
jgi:hypothetical protein